MSIDVVCPLQTCNLVMVDATKSFTIGLIVVVANDEVDLVVVGTVGIGLIGIDVLHDA